MYYLLLFLRIALFTMCCIMLGSAAFLFFFFSRFATLRYATRLHLTLRYITFHQVLDHVTALPFKIFPRNVTFSRELHFLALLGFTMNNGKTPFKHVPRRVTVNAKKRIVPSPCPTLFRVLLYCNVTYRDVRNVPCSADSSTEC